jgi:hypothetical protein
MTQISTVKRTNMNRASWHHVYRQPSMTVKCKQTALGPTLLPNDQKIKALAAFLAISLHDEAGFIRVFWFESNKLNRNHQPFPACGTVINMAILFFCKVDGFDGKLMQSIVIDVLHKSTPWRSA